MPYASHQSDPDVILIGSGIMSANLGAMLKRLEPRLKLQVYEATDELAQESSRGWNNAGTGHAGLCELSYTPKRETDGTVDIAKVLEIFEQFERSKQFWSYAVAHGLAERPREFINPVPHLSFVHGAEMVDFLRARHAAMSAHPFFRGMTYATDPAEIGHWAPLLVEGRAPGPIAATRMDEGTDVNFGVLAAKLLGWLAAQEGCGVATGHRVIALERAPAGGWQVGVKDLATGEVRRNRANFVFVGAGGGSLALLQRSGIAEGRGIGGFPIGGQWLVCDDPAIVARHRAKVYGQPLAAAPTMAVPHLDTRILDGRRTLLFGPFAAWTTKFLHGRGHWTDLPRSVRPDNLATLLKIGLHNVPLVRYLIQQGTQSMADRMDVLRIFYPAARPEDWRLIDAGIRVQAIKKTDGEAGIVHYGTEVITSSDRTLSALLGASPGASVSVSIVLEVIRRCLPHLLDTPERRARMKAMIPTYDVDLRSPGNTGPFQQAQRAAHEILGIR
jgi:malate dehydrogenase (quinone)